MNNNKVKNKMVEILESQVKLVKNLKIVKVKELSSKCKITFKYNNMEATEELQKTCTPQYEIELCRKCINGAISSMYINVDNLIEAKKWLDGEIWKEIDEDSISLYDKIKKSKNSKEMAKLIYNMCSKLSEENSFNCIGIKIKLEKEEEE